MTIRKELPKIYTVLPDEIRDMHPHGQWTLDVPGVAINFACDVTEDRMPIIEPWARALSDFRASTDDVMEFQAPHLPGTCYLHRSVLEHIIATQPAWSRKVLPRPKDNGRVQLVDAGSGLPMVRRKLN
jgi:hypothetical protein